MSALRWYIRLHPACNVFSLLPQVPSAPFPALSLQLPRLPTPGQLILLDQVQGSMVEVFESANRQLQLEHVEDTPFQFP